MLDSSLGVLRRCTSYNDCKIHVSANFEVNVAQKQISALRMQISIVRVFLKAKSRNFNISQFSLQTVIVYHQDEAYPAFILSSQLQSFSQFIFNSPQRFQGHVTQSCIEADAPPEMLAVDPGRVDQSLPCFVATPA
jgi:hypothetical protein